MSRQGIGRRTAFQSGVPNLRIANTTLVTVIKTPFAVAGLTFTPPNEAA